MFDVICNKLASVDPTSFDVLITSLGDFYVFELGDCQEFPVLLTKAEGRESIKDFVAALHKLSIHCNFETYLKTALEEESVCLRVNVIGPSPDCWKQEM